MSSTHRRARFATDHSTVATRLVAVVTGWLGSFSAIILCVAVVVAWVAGGFFGRFDDPYKLIISTAATIVTFLMVFIIQNTQNRDGRAIQTKLDAQGQALRLIADRLGVDLEKDHGLAHLVGVEDAPETAIKEHQDHVRKAAGR